MLLFLPLESETRRPTSSSEKSIASRSSRARASVGAAAAYPSVKRIANASSRTSTVRGGTVPGGAARAAAALMIDEARVIAETTGTPALVNAPMILAAWRGHEGQATELIDATSEEAAARRWTSNNYARSVLYNGLGRHDAARDAAWEALQPDPIGYGTWLVPELAEAASRTVDREVLEWVLEWLCERTRVVRSGWASGIEARVRALLTEGEAAESLYRESIARLSDTRVRLELARTHLLYGEWLRREGRRVDARDQLRTAHELFLAIGMEAFGERARHELLATGERVRTRSVDTHDQLTPQELQIARLASDGRTNPEIGAQLFLSRRTVEWHLRKVFDKLDVRSRRELPQALRRATPAASR